MLNYIWLALIVIGVGVAIGTDWHDLSSNKYHNGEPVQVDIVHSIPAGEFTAARAHACTVTISADHFNAIYGTTITDSLRFRAEFTPLQNNAGAILHIFVDDSTPQIWRDLALAQKNPSFVAARCASSANCSGPTEYVEPDPVKFIRMQAVTNDGIIGYAKTAVELAIGLIGIMALWLGVMKIAEQSGLVAKLAALLKPLTTRVFPDVPPDHPAMGAMIMNIAANILGLANAATPLGLKAMEELNKLNKKLGTATDAMCTFLVINTSNVQLIPATVIAIRAAAGSSKPAEILGPTLLATCISLIVGVTTVKLLAKLRIYRRQLETP